VSSAVHTPGPWVLFEVGGDNGTRPALCPAAEATKQSILTITEEGGTVFAAVLKKEDARLIAAAPELLAAAKAVRDTCPADPDVTAAFLAAWQSLEAAIATATGSEA
jgi:hypothetical protein